MKALLPFFIVIFSCIAFSASSNPASDSLLTELDRELELEEVYISNKLKRIESFQQKLKIVGTKDLLPQYDIYAMLFEEYKSFNYDSAFVYVKRLQDIAYRLKDPTRINEAKIRLSFIFLSSGMFKETFDSLSTVKTSVLSNAAKQEYYTLYTRAYYHLADFNNDNYFTPLYTDKANSYVDSVLSVSEPDSYTFLYFRGLRSARMSDIETGLADLERLYSMGSMSYHQLAVLTSTLSDFYLRIGNTDKAIQLLAKAAIYDIKSSTKETAAILILANILHKQGDLKRAYRYTRKALDEANFYGARHRKIEVGNILPIIEEEKLSTVESQKRTLIFFLAVAIVLALIVVVFVVITMKQLRRLKSAKMEIDTAHTALQKSNYKLQETNSKLSEANRIKEEYIGYYFNINSDYIEKVEKFKRSIDQNLMAQKYDNIRFIVNNINLKKEREELNKSFDRIFLKLFPGFVDEFNSFFKEEDQIKPTDGELLNTDLRIFALIRMGIQDNDKIAKILNYSVNTIYAYKTRIKNKSIIPNEEFEKRMMEIKHI